MIETFTGEVFAGREGEVFRIHVDAAASVEARLVEVRVRAEHASAGRTPFTLLFRGPMDAVLPQRMYRLEHGELGVFELFLVTVGPDAEGMRYEAVFS